LFDLAGRRGELSRGARGHGGASKPNSSAVHWRKRTKREDEEEEEKVEGIFLTAGLGRGLEGISTTRSRRTFRLSTRRKEEERPLREKKERRGDV